MRRLTFIAPLVLLVLGVVTSLAIGQDLNHRADHDLRTKLDGDADELGLIFQGLASQFQAEMQALATIAAVTAGDVDVHERYIVDNELFNPHALIDLNGAEPRLVSVVAPGADEAELASTRAGLESLIADPMVKNRLSSLASGGGGFSFLVSSTGQRAIAGVAHGDAGTYADIFPFDFGAAGVFLVNQLGNVEDFVIYIGSSEEDGMPLMASTESLPLSGHTARTSIDVGGQPLLIEVSGDLSPDVPPLLVTTVGIGGTVLLAGAFLVALRRRDAAERALRIAREAEEQRARMESDLQQAQRMESVGQLAGGIAHDFNNLLAAISATAELIADGADDPQTARDVEEILDATRRGAALTRRLLTFSRRGVSTHERVDVNAVAHDLGDLLRRAIGEHIDLDLQLAPEPLPVIGDPGEIEQILLNLVVNARDAAMGSGHRIRVATRGDGDRVQLIVRDNGAGMSTDVRDRAFEPFFSTKSADDGTGLGLAIVYGIVNRMHGNVWIDSAPNQGTAVTVDLPLAPVAPGEPPAELEPEPAVTAPQAQGVVLLVEDEPAVRRAACRLVERAGYLVHPAGDGLEAIDLVHAGLRPDVLLTDVVLPGDMTGRDVAARVRDLVPAVKVVYASGYSHDVISADQLEHERAAFVAKPFTSQSLLAAIDHVVHEAPTP